MVNPISINIPRAWVTSKEFAVLEKLSIHTVYKWKETGKISAFPQSVSKGCARPGGALKIKYLDYVSKQTRIALGHSNFVINVTGEPIRVPSDFRMPKRTKRPASQ